MKKDLIEAGVWAAHWVGFYDRAAGNLKEKIQVSREDFFANFIPYVEIMVDAMEVGTDIAMKKPDAYQMAVYAEFADDWCRYAKSNGSLASRADALALMKNVYVNAFGPIMSRVQHELFAKKLDDFFAQHQED